MMRRVSEFEELNKAVSDGNRPASKLSAKKIDEDRALMKSL